jgi:hypothetical protein
LAHLAGCKSLQYLNLCITQVHDSRRCPTAHRTTAVPCPQPPQDSSPIPSGAPADPPPGRRSSRPLRQLSGAAAAGRYVQERGIGLRGRWYPVVKMPWVEGLTLNEFVRRHADETSRPAGHAQEVAAGAVGVDALL